MKLEWCCGGACDVSYLIVSCRRSKLNFFCHVIQKDAPQECLTSSTLSSLSGHVECSRSPSIPCQLVEIIEELDPKDQHMAPRFYKKKICSGGLKLTTGHQCQPKSTEKKYLKLYDTRQSKFEQKVYESATACHEVCVCPRKSCTNPKIGICGKYMR